MKKKEIKQITNLLIKHSSQDGIIKKSKVKKVLKLVSKLPYPTKIILLKEYLRRVRLIELTYTLKIESSWLISKQDKRHLFRFFAKNYNIVKIQQVINKDLIAGLRIKIGSNVFDYSLKGQIAKVRDILAET